MEQARGRLRWLADNWVLLIAGLALAGACTTTFVNVIVRYFFTKFVLVGAEELTTLFVSWTIFVGAAAGYKAKMMFGIDVLVNLFPKSVQRVIGAFVDLVVLVTSAYVAYLSWNFSNAAWIRTTSNLSIPYFWLDIPICIGFGMIAFYTLTDLIRRSAAVLRRDAAADGPGETRGGGRE